MRLKTTFAHVVLTAAAAFASAAAQAHGEPPPGGLDLHKLLADARRPACRTPTCRTRSLPATPSFPICTATASTSPVRAAWAFTT